MNTFISVIKYLWDSTIYGARLTAFQDKWRKNNRDNLTRAGGFFPANKVSVGHHTYGTLNIVSYDNTDEKLEIGFFCSISENVKFIMSGEHDYHRMSTYPFANKIINEESESVCRGPIRVCDDVWIGYGCIILSGVTIGQGAVIGAGSVVTKDISPYAVYAGNRVIKYRFDDVLIEQFLLLDFKQFSDSQIKEYYDDLKSTITEQNYIQILQRWPKKLD